MGRTCGFDVGALLRGKFAIVVRVAIDGVEEEEKEQADEASGGEAPAPADAQQQEAEDGDADG